MRIRFLLFAAAALGLFATISVSAQEQIEPGPIQTQIADLHATLTAIPATELPSESIEKKSISLGDLEIEVLGFAPLDQENIEILEGTHSTLATFYRLDLAVTNNGLSPISSFELPWDTLRLTDSLGRSFSYANGPSHYLFGYNGMFLGDLQPGVPAGGFIVWELPEDAEGLTLSVDGSVESVVLEDVGRTEAG